MQITLVYAASNPVVLKTNCEPETSVAELIDKSGLLAMKKNLDLSTTKVGIFGRSVSLNQIVREGDRVEIYRKITRVVDNDSDEKDDCD
ncbi:RnfH family protein [Agaribacterium haliotis]|uniref:RnfH family protein n=1 Tax=Agaribacterium haliotis TaxID=2013869 RepID=UPI001EFE61E5|nr:RnfH family protein [Agaribacterium haliotis]